MIFLSLDCASAFFVCVGKVVAGESVSLFFYFENMSKLFSNHIKQNGVSSQIWEVVELYS